MAVVLSGPTLLVSKLRKCIFTLLMLCVMASNMPSTNSANILVVHSFPGKSHFMMTNTIVKELINRGHKITMITGQTLAPLQLGSNFTEILIEPPYNFWPDIKRMFNAQSHFDFTSMNVPDFVKMYELFGIVSTEHALKQLKVQEIINANKTEGVYDLLFVQQYYQEPFLALAYKYNIPVVSSGTFGFTSYMSQMTGIISPWSFVPHAFMALTDRMTFFERLQNSYYCLYEDLYREFIYFPKMDKLMKRYFSHLPVELPTVSQMEKNLSMILINSYVPLTTTRPTANSLIHVGGVHIYPEKPLPSDIKKFLDEATDGVIFFSLGTNVQSKDMPPEKLKIFFEVFSQMKQRILWKFENEDFKNMPSNIMIKKWLPQRDILAHLNIRVFITHGGLFGTQEGVWNAVPMLGMPFYSDQHLNINKAAKGGYAIKLHFQDITKESLQSSLKELLENPSYKQTVSQVSKVFRDRPMSARDTAVYWVEYAIRHAGAPHIRSAGLDLKWYQFYLLDVIAFVLAIVVFVIALLVFLVRALCCKKKNTIKKQKKH